MSNYVEKGKYIFELPPKHAVKASCFLKKEKFINIITWAYLLELAFTGWECIRGKDMSKHWIFDEVIYSDTYAEVYKFIQNNVNSFRNKKILIVLENLPPKILQKNFEKFNLDLYFAPKSAKIVSSNVCCDVYKYNYLEPVTVSQNEEIILPHIDLEFSSNKIVSKCVISKKMHNLNEREYA